MSDIYGPHSTLVALTVGLALVGIVLWGTLAGSMLPFVLRRLGFDPAASSAPFVATLVDVTGLVIYFSVATVILRGTLLVGACRSKSRARATRRVQLRGGARWQPARRTRCTLSRLSRAPTKQMGPYRRSGRTHDL